MPTKSPSKVRVVKRYIGATVTEEAYAKLERAAVNQKRSLAFIIQSLVEALP